MTKTITLPYLERDTNSVVAFMASEQTKFELLERLFQANGRSLAEVPESYRTRGPLTTWVWLVLTVNNIPLDENERGEPYTLAHYGIDLAFSGMPVRRWVWFLA